MVTDRLCKTGVQLGFPDTAGTKIQRNQHLIGGGSGRGSGGGGLVAVATFLVDRCDSGGVSDLGDADVALESVLLSKFL